MRDHPFQGARGAGLHAFGAAVAAFTFHRLFQLRVQLDHAQGTVIGADAAAHAGVVIHPNHAVFIPGDGAQGTGRGTIGIFTLVADHGEVEEVFPFMVDA